MQRHLRKNPNTNKTEIQKKKHTRGNVHVAKFNVDSRSSTSF